jgi:hypothetical protein
VCSGGSAEQCPSEGIVVVVVDVTVVLAGIIVSVVWAVRIYRKVELLVVAKVDSAVV